MEIMEILKNDPALVKTFMWGYYVLFIIVCGFDYIFTKIAEEKKNTNDNNNSKLSF